MKDFNVLLTCCSIHVKEIIDCLKQNEDGANVKVYVANSVAANLPPEELSDGNFVVPSVTDAAYIETLIAICKENAIQIVIPTATLELEIMAKNKPSFEKEGILVSVSSYESLVVANNKIALHSQYQRLMPKQMVVKNKFDVDTFAASLRYKNSSMCCKMSNLCGGKGFAVIDDKKCNDISLFSKFGEKRYISLQDLINVVGSKNEVILQEHIDGLDYTVSILASNGKVDRICGYVGYIMAFGSIMYGEVQMNDKAYSIATQIVNDLKLDGNLAFDFIQKKNGSVVLLECNPRINASLPLVWRAGCNMPYLRCKQLLGEPLNDSQIVFGTKMKKFYDTRYYV